MAGGQALTSGQGSVGLDPRELALTGLESAGGIGTLVPEAPPAEEALSGEESTLATGSSTQTTTVRLRSRKVGGGAAAFLLTGQFVTPETGIVVKEVARLLSGISSSTAQGAFAKQRTRALSGTAASTATGTMSKDSVPVWGSTPGTVFDITRGSTLSLNNPLRFSDADGDTLTFAQVSGTLPTGVTFDSDTGIFTASGSATLGQSGDLVFSANDSQDDWADRGTVGVNGVIASSRLDTALPFNVSTTPPTSNTVSRWKNGGVDNGAYSLDTVIKPDGSTGSARIEQSSTEGAESQSIRFYFGASRAFTQGDTVWFSIRMYCPPALLYEPWAATASTGLKFVALSNYGEYHSNNEIVLGDPQGQDSPHGYLNGVTFNEQQISVVTSVNPSADFRWQSQTDNGTASLIDVNPDTGLSWTSTGSTSSSNEQERARWGPLYSSRGGGGLPAIHQQTGWRKGIGDWLSGQVRTPHSNWVTFTCRLDIGTWNTANSRWRVWRAPDGQPYTMIKDHQNANVGTDSNPDYTTLWLSHYVTGRTAGGRRVSSRSNNITGVTIHCVGGDMPTGDGTLTWNPTTQRLTFRASGESDGPAVGFSWANNRLLRNVFSGTSQNDLDNKYLIVEFNPSFLPSSPASDTVTIADGRASTFGSFADVIVSTQAINAPGGFAPVG